MSEINPLDMIEHLQEYGAGVEHDTSLISKHIKQNDLNSELIALVKKIERFHQIKKQNLGNDLSELGEPVWKILLRLFVATKTEQKTTVTDLSQQISFPETTVLRYIKILEDNGYTIHLHAPDQPNGWLQLTLQGQTTIRTTLLALNAI